MKQGLGIRLFAHSWISDWNHGNAHFLRGLRVSSPPWDTTSVATRSATVGRWAT